MGRKAWIVIAFVIITIAWWCTGQGYDTGYFKQITPSLKHAINFFLIIFVAVVGYIGLVKTRQSWTTIIWLYTYGAVILFIGVLGFVDLFNRFNDQNFRDFVGYLRAFFTSPIPFAVLVYLGKTVKSEDN